MSRLDEQLRAAARSARTAADGGVELDRDLAATKVRAMSMPPSAAAPGGRSHRWLLAVAAVLLIAVFAGGLVALRGTDGEQIASVSLPDTTEVVATTVVVTTSAPTTVADVTTTAPAETRPTSTSTVPDTSGGTAAIASYLDPPPELSLRSLGRMEFGPAGQTGPSYDVAVGDLGVAVIQPWAGHVTVFGFDGSRREVDIGLRQEQALFATAYGPGEVLYGLTTPDAGATVPEQDIVAIALSGARAGEVVASVPLDVNKRYLELPGAPLGHGPDGVIDRVRDVNATLIGYVDENGAPADWSAARPQLFSTSPELNQEPFTVANDAGTTWTLEVEPTPERRGIYNGPSPAAPSSDGLAVYWTHLGTASPGDDYDDPTTWVIAALHLDGTAEWWSVPDGWWVVASDVWGTVLARRDGAILELALADFGAVTQPFADCSGSMDFDTTISRFVAAMTAARTTGDLTLVDDCLSSVPSVFTGVVPACWTACEAASRTFGSDFVVWGEADGDDGSFWIFELPVSYRTTDGYDYIVETWELHPVGGGYQVSGPVIERPPEEQPSSLAVIAEYLAYVEAADWLAAAQMLYGGAVGPEERPDLQRLSPSSITLDGIAAALERWCAAGCDTTPPMADELTYNSGYSLTRHGETIDAAWFEGRYFVVGLPFRA